MRKELLTATLLLALATPLAQADYVTAHGTVGMLDAQLVTKTLQPAGTVQVWNTAMAMDVVVMPPPGCLLRKVYVYLDTQPPPLPVPADSALLDTLLTEPDYGEWPYGKKFKKPVPGPHEFDIPLADLKFLQWGIWGEPWVQQRTVYFAALVEMQTKESVPVVFRTWAMNPNLPLEAQRTGWSDNSLAFKYELQHPKKGNFAGPVHGLTYYTPTHNGITGVESGGFSFYPGEEISFWIGNVLIGTAKADESISPMDIFPSLETSDAAVVNLTRLLLSLDADGNPSGSINIAPSIALLGSAMAKLSLTAIDFTNTPQIDSLIAKIVALNAVATLPLPLVNVPATDALAWVENSAGGSLTRRNVSKPHGTVPVPPYVTDKPKLEIMPIWMPAKTADGQPTTVAYKDNDGKVIETRNKVKPLVVTYQQEQDPAAALGGQRRASDIFTAVSMDDGATWKRFNVSRMTGHSSFTIKATGEKFPGDCRSPQLKVATTKLLVVWTSAYARGGKPRVSIKTNDDYAYDDAYAVSDIWGVRGTQGSVNYDLDKDVGDQGIGELPYYALWACRGVLVWDGNVTQYPGHEIGDIVWFKPERLTTGRRDAFIPVVGAAKDAGFGIAWQEDPGGLRPGQCMAGGHGWSGATVHKKTDIWYSFINWADFEKVDTYWVATSHTDEQGEESHSLDTEIVSRPKWQVPMALPVRVSDNNTVNTDNMKVELDENGLPVVEDGAFVPLLGAEEEDWVRHEHEHDSECGSADVTVVTEDEEHDGEGGTGGGWGMARYAYMVPELGLADLSGNPAIWDSRLDGEYRPTPGVRWYRFVNQPDVVKTVAVTTDGRVLDGDTGACRPNLNLMPYNYKDPVTGITVYSAWAILGYEETKGLGEPPEGETHDELETVEEAPVTYDSDDTEFNEKGKDVIYHSFKFDQPEVVSAGNVVNLPALDPLTGELIPIYYKDAAGEIAYDADAEGNIIGPFLRQYATENARRVRFIAQSKSEMGITRTPLVVVYKQGVEGNGKPSDIFAIRVVVPTTDKATENPYRFSNFVRFDTGSSATPADMKGKRRHMNMTSATVEAIDPLDIAVDGEGHYYGKVSQWKQYAENLKDESSANPYSDAKGHRGFITGDTLVLGYSFTPNWGRKGGDHSDFYVRRSFSGGTDWTTDPKSTEETVHTVIKRDPLMRGVYYEVQEKYGPGQPEPGRNVSLLKGNTKTVGDPRLVEPMGKFVVNPLAGPGGVAGTPDDKPAEGVYYVAYGTQQVLHGEVGSPFATDLVPEDIYYSRTADGGTTWLKVPWVVNPNSASPDAGETVYRFPWLAQGSPYQGHAQLKMHPNGSRLYAIWHQWTDEYTEHVSPHEYGDDIWFRRIDFMAP